MSRLEGDHVTGDSGGATTDVLLGLLATGGHDIEVDAVLSWLEGQAATFAAGNGPAAGKLAMAVAAAGEDPRSFGGVDLVAEIEAQLQPSGQCGGFGYAFGQALCILGLVRSGAPVDQAAVDFLMTFQDEATGAYGFFAGSDFTADNDSSGLALAALAGVVDQPGARASAQAVRAYLRSARDAGGWWPGFSPVNTTALAGSGLLLVGEDVTAAQSWLVSQQLADGGLPNTADGTTSDLMATAQALLLLGGQSYLSVGAGGQDRVELGGPVSPTTGPTATTGPTPTTGPNPTTGPTPTTGTPGPTTEPTPTITTGPTPTTEPTTTTTAPTGTGTPTSSATTAPGDSGTSTSVPVVGGDTGGHRGPLPRTGSEVAGPVLAGLAAVGLGVALVLVARRREQGSR